MAAVATVTREAYAEVTRHPGKFEGEASYVPYFWDEYIRCFADDDDGEVLTFHVSPRDVAMFPELAGRETVLLMELDNGFVVEVIEI